MSWEEHEAIQTRLAYNKSIAVRNARHQYLLTGMLRCRRCDCNMRGWPSGKSEQFRYICPKCKVRIYLESLERRIWFQVMALLKDPKRYMAEARKKDSVAEQTRDSLLKEMADYQRRLKAALDKEKKLALQWLSDQISQEALTQVQALVRAERAHYEEQLELAQGRLQAIDRVAITVRAVEDLGTRIGDKLEGADFNRRKWVLSQMFAKVYYTPGKEPPNDVELEVALAPIESEADKGSTASTARDTAGQEAIVYQTASCSPSSGLWACR
jgi:hypothetical protein